MAVGAHSSFDVCFAFSSIRRAAALSEGRGDALHDATTAQLERIVGGPVVDLRGGKTTTGSKKVCGEFLYRRHREWFAEVEKATNHSAAHLVDFCTKRQGVLPI